MISTLLLASLLLIAADATAPAVAVQTDSVSSALEQAESDVSSVIALIDAYSADPLSRFEAPEIAAVQRDIATIRKESDEAAFVAEATVLERDFETLVGLDEVLQQESAI